MSDRHTPGRICVVTRLQLHNTAQLLVVLNSFYRLRRAARKSIPGFQGAALSICSRGSSVLMTSVWKDVASVTLFTGRREHVAATAWCVSKCEVQSGVYQIAGLSSLTAPDPGSDFWWARSHDDAWQVEP